MKEDWKVQATAGALILIFGYWLGGEHAKETERERRADRENPPASYRVQATGGVFLRVEEHTGHIDVFNPQTRQWQGVGTR